MTTDTYLGCFSRIWYSIGKVEIYGAHKDQKSLLNPLGGFIAPGIDSIITDAYKDGGNFQDDIYDKIATHCQSTWTGLMLIGDRVNRGSPKGGSHDGSVYVGRRFNAANFAKFLAKNAPKYGNIFASPVFQNPTHREQTSYSMCQIWMWFGKEGSKQIYTDFDNFIGPRTKEFTWDEAVKNSPKKVLEEAKPTYD